MWTWASTTGQGTPPTGSTSTDLRAQTERLRGARIGRWLRDAVVERPELGHQRLVPRRLLLGHQRVGGEDQPGDRRAVLQRGAHDPQRVDDAHVDHVAVAALQRVESFVD